MGKKVFLMTDVLSIAQSLWNDNAFLFCSFHFFLIVIAFILLGREIRNNEQQTKSSSSTLKSSSSSTYEKNDADEKDTPGVEKSTGFNNSNLISEKRQNYKRENNKSQQKISINDTNIQQNEDSNNNQNNVTKKDPQNRKDSNDDPKNLITSQEKVTKQTNEQKWRCACEGSFLPPTLLRSFGGAEAIFKAGMGQCYHK